MNRDKLADDATAYQIGLIEGREQGIAMERSRIRPIEWAKLFTVVVVASTIGCGIILAIAVGISVAFPRL